MTIRAATAKLAPQFLQAGILRGEAAERGGVDHQQRTAGIVGEPDVAARERRETKMHKR